MYVQRTLGRTKQFKGQGPRIADTGSQTTSGAKSGEHPNLQPAAGKKQTAMPPKTQGVPKRHARTGEYAAKSIGTEAGT